MNKRNKMKGIGGSNIASILNLCPFKTKYQLFCELTGIIEPDNLDSNESVQWGCIMESVIRQEFSVRNNFAISTYDTIFHKDHDFLFAHIDGFIESENAVLEIKTAHEYAAHQWEDGIPMNYLLQLAYYVMLTDASYGVIAVLIGGNKYREYRYERDRELEQSILRACIRFWSDVVALRAPDAINLDDLKLMHFKSAGEAISATESVLQHALDYVDLDTQIKQLQERKECAKFQIQKFMGACDTLLDADGKPLLTWKSTKTGARVFSMKKGDK